MNDSSTPFSTPPESEAHASEHVSSAFETPPAFEAPANSSSTPPTVEATPDGVTFDSVFSSPPPKAPSRALKPSPRVLFRRAFATTWASVRHNGPLVLASFLAMAMSLALVGASLLVRSGVQNATLRWQGGVELIVFVKPGTTPQASQALGDTLAAQSGVSSISYVDQLQAVDEFKQLFQNSPQLVANVTPESLPASWRIVPREGLSPDQVESIGKSVSDSPDVFQVVYAKDAVESVVQISSLIQSSLYIGALVMGVVSLLLVWTTCRAAAWARRDELAVMRLVGAPRWLVRAPFVLEGAFTGLLGGVTAAIACAILFGSVQAKAADADSLAIFRNFSLTTDTLVKVGIFLALFGVLLGSLASSLAVQRHVEDRPRRSSKKSLKKSRRVSRRDRKAAATLVSSATDVEVSESDETNLEYA